MRGLRKLLLLTVVFITIASCASPRQHKEAPEKGSYAPDFTLYNLKGEEVSLSSLRGKKVVLNFWATWCPPCREEMSTLQKVYEEQKSKGVIIVGVNVGEEPARVRDFLHEAGVEFPILLDTDWEVAWKYRIRGLPCTFWIDEEGIIREITIGGPMPEDFINDMLDDLNER